MGTGTGSTPTPLSLSSSLIFSLVINFVGVFAGIFVFLCGIVGAKVPMQNSINNYIIQNEYIHILSGISRTFPPIYNDYVQEQQNRVHQPSTSAIAQPFVDGDK